MCTSITVTVDRNSDQENANSNDNANDNDNDNANDNANDNDNDNDNENDNGNANDNVWLASRSAKIEVWMIYKIGLRGLLISQNAAKFRRKS